MERNGTKKMKKNLYELSRVAVQLVAEPPFASEWTITSASDAVTMLRNHMERMDREQFVAVHLDTKKKPISCEVVSIGSLNASLVSPREVYKAAILSNAAAIIVLHNHPSGNPQPSDQDDQVTKRLCKAGKILGIEVLDHIVVGRNGEFYSYKSEDRLPEEDV